MPPIFVEARELAKRLDVSYDTVLTWVRRGTIPHVRADRGHLMFNLDSVIEALRQKRPRSVAAHGDDDACLSAENQSPRIARVLIVVVTEIEFEAVMSAVQETGVKRIPHRFVGDHTYFELGVHGGCALTLVRCEMGSGGPTGSFATLIDAITAVKPAAILMVGIAFGTKSDKQQIGDVVISRQILAYELQRVTEGEAGQMSRWNRGDRVQATARLLDRFRSGARDWGSAMVHFGLILSGDKLVDSPSLKKELLGMEAEAIGGEMEGAGLYAAASKGKVDWIMIKGIADWGEQKGDKDQATAAENAVDLMFHVIRKGGLAV